MSGLFAPHIRKDCSGQMRSFASTGRAATLDCELSVRTKRGMTAVAGTRLKHCTLAAYAEPTGVLLQRRHL
jgi:hypothetical protein